MEPNPFFLPEFLDPAARALRPSRLRLAVITDRDELIFFAPVRIANALDGAALTVWAHEHAQLGVPLIDRRHADVVPEILFDFLRAGGRHTLMLPDLSLGGPVARLLRLHAGEAGSWSEALVGHRPILKAGETFEIPARPGEELERQMQGLAEEGSLSVMTARSRADLEAAFDVFVAVEASRPKARRASALGRQGRVSEFARAAVLALADRGLAEIDLLRCGDRAASALIRFETDGLAVPWKITEDESLAGYAPGKQLMSDASRRWLASATMTRVDAACDRESAAASILWQGAERYGTLMLSTSRLGLGIGLRGGYIDARAAARRRLNRLLRRNG